MILETERKHLDMLYKYHLPRLRPWKYNVNGHFSVAYGIYITANDSHDTAHIVSYGRTRLFHILIQ
jgi:hypothetical protein